MQVPVVEGYSFPHLTKRLNVAGRHISAYLLDLLVRRKGRATMWGGRVVIVACSDRAAAAAAEEALLACAHLPEF